MEIFNSKLTKDDKRIDLKSRPRALFSELGAAASKEKVTAERNCFQWTQGVIKIFRIVNRYAVVGDVIAQHHPEYTALAWGAFRLLMLVGSSRSLIHDSGVSTDYVIECCRREEHL